MGQLIVMCSKIIQSFCNRLLFLLQDTFKGRLILRFDDTNPSKEKANFEESILCDLPRIGVKWDVRSHTSDHFDLLIKLCEQMLREGKAYVDNTDAETMRIERENRKPSACRENSKCRVLPVSMTAYHPGLSASRCNALLFTVFKCAILI